ncbi:unnamed protein product [Ambrosiozyma monospora]|uniref:Unnamed protein product n=1 Tax=Ambrosiozyma monospora TaxID=43982 RepID=A0A9W6YWJ7_AMBMO|nr:unnamed protein product [Ambrosiozyma monospora]
MTHGTLSCGPWVTRRLAQKGYQLKMKQNDDDAFIIFRDNIEELLIPAEESARRRLDSEYQKYLNEVKIRSTMGPLRIISVCVPSPMKEKKEFLEQWNRVYINLKFDITCNILINRARAISYALHDFSNPSLIASINDPIAKERKVTTPEIAKVFTQYNKQVFQEQNQQQNATPRGNNQSVKPTPELNQEEQNNLAKPITLDEIKQALQQQMTSNANSAPGRDGIPYKFLLTTFETMGPRLLEVFNHLLVANDLPEMMKPVLLKFILKDGKDRSEVSSYRPIALISSTARLFSKVIVNRLQSVFARIISPDQQGFIAGRSSHNNIQRLQHVVDCIKAEPEVHAQSTILQLDFQKAFI